MSSSDNDSFQNLVRAMTKNFAIVSTGSELPYTTVQEVPIPKVLNNKILIKSVAFAVNPLDTTFETFGFAPKGAIIGCDVSGVVEEVGPNVTGFAKGDKVSSWVHGNFSQTEGAFANYVVVSPATTIKYDTTFTFGKPPVKYGVISSFEGAAAVTASLSIIALNLSYGFDLSNTEKYNEKYILVWGGSSSSGVAAIQLAKKVYGLNVITTSSPKHHTFLKEIGADYVFDYHDSEVTRNIIEAGNGNIEYGLDTISTAETFQNTYDATSGSKKVTIINLLFLQEDSIKLNPVRTDAVTFKSLPDFMRLVKRLNLVV